MRAIVAIAVRIRQCSGASLLPLVLFASSPPRDRSGVFPERKLRSVCQGKVSCSFCSSVSDCQTHNWQRLCIQCELCDASFALLLLTASLIPGSEFWHAFPRDPALSALLAYPSSSCVSSHGSGTDSGCIRRCSLTHKQPEPGTQSL